MWADDVDLPEAVAADITGGILLLNEDLGRLLILPYAGEFVVAYGLREGTPIYPPLAIRRYADHGLRMAEVRLLLGLGALLLTESTLACFQEDCTLAWRQDGDFAGWTIEGTTCDEVLLLAGDWTGMEQRQRLALADGTRLS